MQSLLDLLCSQLKNLLSQAGVSVLSSGNDRDNKKHEDGTDSEKKDFRGRYCPLVMLFSIPMLKVVFFIYQLNVKVYNCAFVCFQRWSVNSALLSCTSGTSLFSSGESCPPRPSSPKWPPRNGLKCCSTLLHRNAAQVLLKLTDVLIFMGWKQLSH